MNRMIHLMFLIRMDANQVAPLDRHGSVCQQSGQDLDQGIDVGLVVVSLDQDANELPVLPLGYKGIQEPQVVRSQTHSRAWRKGR